MGNRILYALAVRVLIAVFTRTFFQPDEYFQALEPAHHLVFGYGSLTWEWLNPLPIRSIIYPALNIPIYWMLKVTGLHSIRFWGDWLVIICPRILHGVLAAGTDIWLCKITSKVMGQRYVSTAFFLSLTSFFHALSLSRSLSNSFETTLTTIALSYFPWGACQTRSPQTPFYESDIRKCLTFAALACIIRPTSTVIWVFLFANLLWSSRAHRGFVLSLVMNAVVIGSTALSLVIFLDYLYYGQITFAPVNFFIINLSGVSLFYGGNPWHYYLTQALPILCTTSLPFVLYGMWTQVNGIDPAKRTLCRVIIWTIAIYSSMGHKEWRFIHPVLPLMHVLGAKVLVDLSDKSPKQKISSLPIRRDYFSMLLIPIPIALYVTLLYCSAPVAVLSYIRSIPSDELKGGSVGFLMPCHSTPGHAYIHRSELASGGMWALGCEPPLEYQPNLSTYRDQTTIFFSSPYDYLQDRFPSTVNPNFPLSPYPVSIPGTSVHFSGQWRHEWPRHLVFFGALLEKDGVKNMLLAKKYQEVWHGGRSWEGDGEERQGGVRVWKWRG
ncbi:glycosyltransferase family 22 protein [Mucidula mucida]|nr:glycosyltransferase family 22 protein [Mucidula mucida]